MCDEEDIFEDDDSSSNDDEALTQGGVSNQGKNKLAARRRLEDLQERRALREQLGEDYYDELLNDSEE